jgi:fatty acid desaturase
MPSILRLAMMAFANADIVQRIEDRVSRYGRAAGLALAAFFLALIAIAFLFQTLAAWLTLKVGPIWAPLIVAGVLFLLCAILALVAYLTLHGKSKPKHQTAAAALPGKALAALPDLAPAMRNRLPEIVAVAVVTGLLLGRHRRRR